MDSGARCDLLTSVPERTQEGDVIRGEEAWGGMTRRESTQVASVLKSNSQSALQKRAGRGKSVKTEKPKTFVDKNPPIT